MSAENEIQYWLNKDGYNFSEHQYKLGILENELTAQDEKRDVELFAILKPKHGLDGNMYFVLFGEDLQTGISGFGDTFLKAVSNWAKSMRSQTIKAIGEVI